MRTALLALILVTSCDHDAGIARLGAPCECVAYPCELTACGEGAACFAGTCATRCASDDDCPTGAVCNTESPRSCEYPCETAADCPADLDRCDGACFGGPVARL